MKLDWETHVDKVHAIIPRSVKEISSHGFSECKGLESICFEDGAMIEKIGAGAFTGTGLKEFIAPPSLREIKDFAFARCRYLKCVQLNEDIESVADTAFFWTPKTQIAQPSRLDPLSRYVVNLDDLKRISLPEDLDVVGESWFMGSSIAYITIPEKVAEIRPWAFSDCKKLRSVEFAPNS